MNNNKIPKYLPLLRYASENFGDSDIFQGVNVIFSLHHTGDLIPLSQEMQRLGLQTELAWFFEIPYSSNEIIKSKLMEVGFLEENIFSDRPISILEAYEYNQFTRAKSFIPKAILNGINRGANKTIIMDDGGNSSFCKFEIAEIQNKFYHPISIIEQTANGMRQHRKQMMHEICGIINIAETKAKKKFESPTIAKSIWNCIKDECLRENIPLNDKTTVLVLGYGDISQALIKQLSKNVSDQQRIIIKPEPQNRFYHLNHNTLVPINSSLKNKVDLVLGCSGSRSFHHSFLFLLAEKSLLINTSSWTLDFLKDEWISAGLNITSIEDDERRLKTIHDKIVFKISTKQVVLLNGGFPINFSGTINPSPPEKMQLTVSLMLAGAIQALKYDKGEYMLDIIPENKILGEFLNNSIQDKQVTYFSS